MNPLPRLKLNPVLAAASPAGLAGRAKKSEVKLHAAGAPLVLAGSPLQAIYLIAAGQLEIRRRNRAAGTELLMGVLGPPAVLGDAELYGNSTWPHTVRTAVKSTVVHIPCEAFDRFVEAEPAVSYGLYRDACARHMLVIHIAEIFGLQKTAHQILRLLASLAQNTPPGEPRRVCVSQTALARSLGINFKTVSRILEQLETARLIRRDGADLILTVGEEKGWTDLKQGFGAAWSLPTRGLRLPSKE